MLSPNHVLHNELPYVNKHWSNNELPVSKRLAV
jgi:hypothetical protein